MQNIERQCVDTVLEKYTSVSADDLYNVCMCCVLVLKDFAECKVSVCSHSAGDVYNYKHLVTCMVYVFIGACSERTVVDIGHQSVAAMLVSYTSISEDDLCTVSV